MLAPTYYTVQKNYKTTGFYRSGSANRMILVRYDRVTSTGYTVKAKGFRRTVKKSTFSLIYLFCMYSMMVILPKLNCILETPLPPNSYP